MIRLRVPVLAALLFLWLPGPLSAMSLGYKGLLAGWLVGKFERNWDPSLGLRYIPEFYGRLDVTDSAALDAELSFNAFGSAQFLAGQDTQTDGDINPYRMWARFSTAQFEARLGLQKINFGSASLLRPLMWFDSLDPRDPLQLTDGVYGLLLRYYFVNNANVWLWGLYGNDNLRGLESVPTAEDSFEYGGRVQLPLFSGELAATYHHRRADLSRGLLPIPLGSGSDPLIPEHRLGLDGKWDLGVGLWFEFSLTHLDHDLIPRPWERALNLGIDYTFAVGNGLNVLGEHFRFGRAEKLFSACDRVDFSALLLRYPFSILDDVTAIVYYEWERENWYRFLSWQRTYDRWRFNLILFWNPDAFLIYPSQQGANPFSGQGFQFMVVYNY
jgi:hypothetical protein